MVGVKFGKAGGHTAAALAQAMREGYKFIDLRLINPLFNGVQGAQILAHKQSVKHVTGETVYTFQIKGGPLFFDWTEERFGNFCQMVDTEHNRNFLRELIKKGRKWFEIVDKKLEADIINSIPAPDCVTAPTAAPAPQTMTIAELMAALNKARAAEGLPPVDVTPEKPDAVEGVEVTNIGQTYAEDAPAAPTIPLSQLPAGMVTNTNTGAVPVAVTGAASGAKRGFPTRRTPKSGLVTITE